MFIAFLLLLEKKIFENGGHIHVFSPGQKQTTPGVKFLSLTQLFSKFSPLLHVFPIKMLFKLLSLFKRIGDPI